MTTSSAAGPTISTPLTTLLGIRHPVLLAPMGDTAGGQLAAAVSAAGGLGLIGGGYADPQWLATELAAAGDARVGVGFITFALDRRPDSLRLALDTHPVAVQLSFGDPRRYADDIHAAGALLICQVQSPEEIELAVAAGADVIIAQGQDAGGHGRPDRGTIGLIPSVVDAVAPLPVVAAGGIADGRGLAAALMLGASGVTMGTRFLASTAARSSPAEAAALVAGRASDTVRTDVFDIVRGPHWPEGHDGRVVANEFTQHWAADPDVADAERRFRASAADDYSVRPLWAGQGLDMITSIQSPAAIMADIISQAVGCINDVRRKLVES
ncbi:MAG TPA: nitronate monooxygenase [Ilumatobacteraceae bacterium]|nr:nitronate monooxygenase [Ilumatobacteraceae bacterium]HRB03787.1 nitronate monooxygenase [Ilumatobacteraceae bacterium]